MKRIRIGNIELRPLGEEDDNYSAEIIKWYPNIYYGRENDFIKVDDEKYRYKDHENCFVHKSCFKNLESRYTLAFVTKSEEPDILSVYNRPWDLSEEDKKDFEQIIKMIYNGKF